MGDEYPPSWPAIYDAAQGEQLRRSRRDEATPGVADRTIVEGIIEKSCHSTVPHSPGFNTQRPWVRAMPSLSCLLVPGHW